MISRKRKSITGRQISGSVPISIKPTKSRKIIRRFHLLINKRRILCNKLGISLVDNDEDANKKTIADSLSPEMKLQYEMGTSRHDMEPQLLKAQSLQSERELVQCLGYIMNQIHSRGGLRDYQLASRVGQTNNRGGDSSKILVQWLQEMGHRGNGSLSALEIGSLSTENRISTCGIFQPVVRIDLQSSQPGIQRQDFMQRPLPKNDDEKFDFISCSLVLNFVPTPIQRGHMCTRFEQFLRASGYLFVVLPLPCINHSRYMNKNHFVQLMEFLGYSVVKYHEAKKLCYILLRLTHPKHHQGYDKFAKKHKFYDKPGFNNFSIIL
ncbi:hypothetical protein ZYGR_0AG02420 [Zygosaccharomyces rouxii]|uniref:25S rRNA adenine-N(1) methyltransferase n=1 Tax=Zygosaccharomyces rouxii TaxID=4956 RepID=A0A1Q3A9E1_ZYGRO|nr:hypothetical protein ZYGR_0AG02420 [Zygosaccharomyces rouxii]